MELKEVEVQIALGTFTVLEMDTALTDPSTPLEVLWVITNRAYSRIILEAVRDHENTTTELLLSVNLKLREIRMHWEYGTKELHHVHKNYYNLYDKGYDDTL